jgi:hypothetical protein
MRRSQLGFTRTVLVAGLSTVFFAIGVGGAGGAPGDLTLVSVDTGGVTGGIPSPAGGALGALSADGTKVAFHTGAGVSVPIAHVYLRDASAGTTTLVSSDDASMAANNSSVAKGMSADGSKVAFISNASNLDTGDGDTRADAYVKDMVSDDVRLVSTSSSGQKMTNAGTLGAMVDALTLSADGSTVAFVSNAQNLGATTTCVFIPGSPFGPPQTICPEWHVYVKDLATGAVTVADTSDSGVLANGNPSFRLSLSADGSRVAFASNASNLAPEGGVGGPYVYVKDVGTGDIVLGSTDSAGVVITANEASLSADGTKLAFAQSPESSVHVKDLSTGTTLSSPSTYGASGVSLSGDGSKVAFATANSLDPADGDSFNDVYVADLAQSTLELATRTSGGVKADNDSGLGLLDYDGDRVVFMSAAQNLGVVSVPCCAQHVYLKELGSSPDVNGDGIADTLQPSGTPTGSFSNTVDGRANPTIGTVESGSVTVTDALCNPPLPGSCEAGAIDPTKGVRIAATTDAAVWVCGPPSPPTVQLDIPAGFAVTVTCGSVIVEDITAPAGSTATVDVSAGGITVSFPPGTGGTVSTSGPLTVTHVSGDGVKVTVGGVEVPLPEGDLNWIRRGSGSDTIAGTDGNDVIIDSGGSNTVNGRGGDDTIVFEGKGSNKVTGGDGDDSITTGAGSDVIDGGAGDDTIQAGKGSNDVKGGSGDDELRAGSGSDKLDCGSHVVKDTYHAGGGSNTVRNCEEQLAS